MSKNVAINKIINISAENQPIDTLSDLLRKLQFRATVFFREQYCGDWAIDTSGSEQVPFHLVTHGESWLHNDGQKPTQLMSGHLVLFPHDAPHLLSGSESQPNPDVINQDTGTQIDGPVTRLICGYFSFDKRAATPLLASLPGTIVLNLSDSPSSGTRELVQLWMREAGEKNLGSDIAVDRYAELIFIHVLRTQMAIGGVSGLIGALADERLGNVLAAIHHNPGASHQLKEMAAACHLSDSAFTQRFKKHIGMTPGNYVRHWRMQSAAAALRETNLPMAEIANNVGYDSEVAFRKAFSSHFNQGPGKYRREFNKA